ncbi:hypothetical protein SDRG_05357 [Saprolegnia diclina VS20]|uniref:Importin N-terminal domain-containing protein n=1 Tax=Saprolegnia diclina (strain VS20) TaxID=1156394 RepID=T0QT00_SAPDV|nr:hypothetical protein SDRG_05357 [Saprolegnia diclina VS20]EQC37130.1 hypothetical protein SDRG_05357 [Saprolegnia diclina VS20]|eukprot:XP_008609292.1 hypothetical protein SDRG_05357 [Saprolegnia diclina VS20]
MDANELQHFEMLCTALYQSADERERSMAQQSVLVLQSSAEHIPRCQHILDNSTNMLALLVASTSLTKLITTHWNNFTPSQRIDIRNYVLGYLAQKGPSLEKYVTVSLIQLVCRLTKFGWFDDEQFRELNLEVSKFLQATVDHCIIGLQILNELVTEMNQPVTGRNLTFHRKIAVAFRDASLFHIFQVALTTVKTLHMKSIPGATPDQENRMADYALGLAIKCLSFDFIGINPDESAEDAGALQVPTTWRAIIQEPETMSLLFDFYHTTSTAASPNAARCLETLMLLASVRRSLFSPDQERAAFLSRLLTGICRIISMQQGLSDPANYHEFCRLLSRLKSNYQLSELMKAESFQEWMELTPEFTVKSFTQWQWSANSVHYLLGLWSRLVAALPYVRTERNGAASIAFLDNSIPRIVQSYVQSRLDSALAVAADDAVDDPLGDEGSLAEQFDKLPTICHYNYRVVGEYLLTVFDTTLTQYREAAALAMDARMDDDDDSLARGMHGLEMQLAWLVYIVGSIIGGHSYASPQAADGDEVVDADLSNRVFATMKIVEHRLISSGGRTKCHVHLELAFLHYFSFFRRSYIGEQHGMPSAPTPTLAASPVASPLSNPLLGMSPSDSSMSLKTKTYQRMFERMGYGDHTVVVNMIVTHIGQDLKFWGDEEKVISSTLTLFLDIASGYSSGKLLLGLDTVQYLIGHHTADEFPFLAIPSNTRHRTSFHSTISRLLFTTAFDESSDRFEDFVKPMEDVLNTLMHVQNYRQPDVREAIIGVCRDLRGVFISTHNKRTYNCMFDLLYPTYMPIFAKAADVWYDTPSVMNALLKFLQELAYNKSQRVVFDQSSPNGILLFRELSQVIVAYGSRVLQNNRALRDPYAEKYKGISLCLGILFRALGGNYVNFGVFKLYNDAAWDRALEVSLQMALSIPIDDLINYPKVKNAYFFFLEILFRNQLLSVVALDVSVFSQLVQSLHEGVNSYDLTIAAQCATAVDHLASLFYTETKKKKDSQLKHLLLSHLQASPNLWSTLLSSLFNILIYGDASSQWALSRPILSLSLCSPDALQAYEQNLASSQANDANKVLVEEAFAKLYSDILQSLEASNRDKFTQKLGQFRNSLRGFLTIQ